MSLTTDPVPSETARPAPAPTADPTPAIGPAAASEPGPPPEAALDRYVSFIGLDCDAKAAALVAGLREAMTSEDRADPFWDYFVAKLDGHNGPRHDELYQVHCHLNDLRDLAERWDQTTLADLIDTLEVDCC